MSLLREASEMSANCLFLALPQNVWEQLRSEPQTGLDVPTSPVLYVKEAGGGYAFRGLTLQEDVVDALQFLVGDADEPESSVPFVGPRASARPIDESVGQPTPLDGQAWYLAPDEVRRAAVGLARVAAQELASRFDAEELEDSGLVKLAEGLDHLEPWMEEDLPALQQSYSELVEYFQQAAERREGMLVLLEDGPVSALDLGME
ncbi:protein of unknown function [Stigmatella aurantiaca]|uniref:Uncharacterized protein n=1 Tax=Stigmatella aurantiaca TaxID=41 RepID=A0A1H7HZG5_STIAU|nr:DUF1877 family protein [Stigmatella aurantiaca]SEK53625.1 protein of unknown function [Stigmatella aurantiaca]